MKKTMLVSIFSFLTWLSLNSIAHAQYYWSEFRLIGSQQLDLYGYIENEWDYFWQDWYYLQVGVDAAIYGPELLDYKIDYDWISAQVEVPYGVNPGWYTSRVQFWVWPDVWWQLYDTDIDGIRVYQFPSGETSYFSYYEVYPMTRGLFYFIFDGDDPNPPQRSVTEYLSDPFDSCNLLDNRYRITLRPGSTWQIPANQHWPNELDGIAAPAEWVAYYVDITHSMGVGCGWSTSQTMTMYMGGGSKDYAYNNVGMYIDPWYWVYGADVVFSRGNASGDFLWIMIPEPGPAAPIAQILPHQQNLWVPNRAKSP